MSAPVKGRERPDFATYGPRLRARAIAWRTRYARLYLALAGCAMIAGVVFLVIAATDPAPLLRVVAAAVFAFEVGLTVFSLDCRRRLSDDVAELRATDPATPPARKETGE